MGNKKNNNVLDSNNITSMLPKNVSTTYRHILISGGITILMFGKGHIKHPSFYKMILKSLRKVISFILIECFTQYSPIIVAI